MWYDHFCGWTQRHSNAMSPKSRSRLDTVSRMLSGLGSAVLIDYEAAVLFTLLDV